MKNEHSDNCRHKGHEKMQYALMQLTKDKKILISADEVLLFDTYLEYAKNKDTGVNLDLSQSDNEPLQLVYGGMLFNHELHSYKQIEDIVYQLKEYAFYDLDIEKVNVSSYQDIILYPELTNEDANFIPFAAIMQMSHRLINMSHSITIFPSFEEWNVWESMVNRPFILACRESTLIDDITVKNWKEFINKDRMVEIFSIADLVE